MNNDLVMLFAIMLLAAGCQSRAERECDRTVDCPEREFCRMGFCVPAVAHDDATVDDATVDDTRGRGARMPSRDIDGGRAPSDATAPIDGTRRDVDPCDGRPPTSGDLVVNEILVDVPGGDDGDANGDGLRDAFDDEFVELVNRSDDRLDLAGVELLKDGDPRTELTSVCLESGTAVVVFGGGNIRTLSETDAVFRVADSRLGFPNSGGTFQLHAADGTSLAEINWNSPPSESLTLEPQIDGTSLLPHSSVAPGRKISPGRCADGTKLTGGCPAPETSDAGEIGDDSDAGRGDAED